MKISFNLCYNIFFLAADTHTSALLSVRKVSSVTIYIFPPKESQITTEREKESRSRFLGTEESHLHAAKITPYTDHISP